MNYKENKDLKNGLITVFLLTILTVGLVVFKFNTENTKTPAEYIFSTIENVNITPKGTFERAWRIVKNNYLDTTYNHQDWGRWYDRYKNKINTKVDSYVAIESMLESLNDPYSRFLKPDEFAEQNRDIDAKVFGIGVHIADYKGNVIIVNVIEDSPAEKAGLKAGDRILKVNGVSTKGMALKDVAESVRGIAGSRVSLVLLRGTTQISKNILRKEVKLKSVKHKMLDKQTAYIKISTFLSEDAALETYQALRATQKSQGIILDLRGNHGGLLPNSIIISNMFIKDGIIVSVVDRAGGKEYYKAESQKFLTDKPMVVLINGESASASEILSGALKDHKRALLIGEKTFGKGLVQRILKLPDGSGINLTVAKYLTPNGNDIGHKGIEPDYKVGFTVKQFMAGKDPQLEKAKQVLREEVTLNQSMRFAQANK